MTIQALINPYRNTWVYFRNQSEIVTSLQQDIDTCRENIELHQAMINRAPERLKKLRFSYIQTRQYQPKRNFNRIYSELEKEVEAQIEERQKLIADNESDIETHTTNLQDAENLYYCSVLEVTALLATTIFGLGALGGLLITGVCVSGVLLVGLVATISLLSREVFLFARNSKQFEHFNPPDTDVEGVIQFAADLWTRDMLSQSIIRPIVVNIFRHFFLR